MVHFEHVTASFQSGVMPHSGISYGRMYEIVSWLLLYLHEPIN